MWIKTLTLVTSVTMFASCNCQNDTASVDGPSDKPTEILPTGAEARPAIISSDDRRAAPPGNPSPRVNPNGSVPDFVGAARIDKHGTITMRIHSRNRAFNAGEYIFETDHADYARIKAHLGDISTGQTVQVAPFADDQ